jgi:hypothetical protein
MYIAQFSFIVLAHGSNSPQVDMFPYLDSRHDIAEILLKMALNTKNQSINLLGHISWFRANQSLLLVTNALYLVGKQQIQIQ